MIENLFLKLMLVELSLVHCCPRKWMMDTSTRSLSPHEKNYCISELETLGLVWAVRYFRPYLLGHHTIVYTDHSTCLSLLNTPHPSGKLACWALTIQETNLTLKHRSGRQNVNTDALSRNPVTISDPISNSNEILDACEESKSVFVVTSKVKCSDSVRPVCFHCSVCSVFAGVAEPDNSDSEPKSVSNDSEPISMSNYAPQPDDVGDSNSEPVRICSSECLGSTFGDSCEARADEQVADQKSKESLKEVCEMQLKDPDLALYVTYLECHTLPHDRVAKRIVLESRRMEIIDGILYHEDVSNPGRWCIVVPKPLRQELLEENHSTVFAGHFPDRKIYDCLHRTYWWSGMRADVRRFCQGCLSCASRDQDVESIPYFNLYQFEAPFIGLVLTFLNYLLLPVEINI